MASVSLTTVFHHLRSMAVDEENDGLLLQRFVGMADETAFGALVRRHGRVVLGVCRRILGTGPDVEDVFQATFVVLARKAGSIRKQSSVASWLYGVAYRLAVQIKGQRVRRQKREQVVDSSLDHRVETQTMRVDPCANASIRELGTILDEELQRLPAGCREALVLCFMEGLSHAEAAHHLGWPLGTLKGRVQRGRDLLRQRLGRRGVALSAMGIGVMLAEQTNAAVPAALARTALQGAAHNAVSAKVAALAEGAMHCLAVGKLKLAVFAACAVGLLGLGVSALPLQPSGAIASTHAVSAAGQEGKVEPVVKDAFGDPLPPGATARLGTVRWRHGAPVHFVAMLPDGKTVVSTANDRFVRIWDFATGKELQRIGPGPQADVPLPSGAIRVIGFGRMSGDLVAVSKDGKLLATRFDEPEIELWEVATGKKVGTIPLGKDDFDVGGIAFAPDRKVVAMISARGAVRLWDIDAAKIERDFGMPLKLTAQILGGTQTMAVYAPDGKTLVAVNSEFDNGVVNHIKFWDPRTGKELRAIKVEGRFGTQTSPVFSPDSELFAYATAEGEIHLQKAVSGELLHKWKVATAPIWPLLTFSVDSTRLYSKIVGGPAITEWDVKTGKELRTLAADKVQSGIAMVRTGINGCLTLSPDGKMLAAGGEGNTIRFVDIATGKNRPPVGDYSHGLLGLSYTPDGKTLWTRGTDATLCLWDTATGKQVKQVPSKALSVAVTPDGRYSAAVTAKLEITLIDNDNDSGKQLLTMTAKPRTIPTCCFSPDGRILLVHQVTDNSAVLYDVPSGKERCRVVIPGAQKMPAGGFGPGNDATFFFAPDSRRLAVYSAGGVLNVHDTASGKVVNKILPGETLPLRGGAFAPDGRTIALDFGNGLVQLVELATGKERRTFGKKYTPKPLMAPGGGGVMAYRIGSSGTAGTALVAFSPDGRLLAHVGPDNVVHIWNVATGQALGRFEGHSGMIGAIAFAPDGQSVATASNDTTALVWNVKGTSARAGPTPEPQGADAVLLRWNELTVEDGVAGEKAINSLIASPKSAVTLLKAKLQPAVAVNAAVVEKLMEHLDSDEFKLRQKAQVELLAIGDQVVPFLDKALAGNPPLERQQRLQQVHAKLTAAPITGERLRIIRAIEVLERIGNPDTREVLQTLADGAPGALTTTQARAALERLKKAKQP
jgi:RNA polymerase sigma factor (sigma-70 family)